MGASDDAVGKAFLTSMRENLKESVVKIRHCVEQLSEEDIAWRPYEAHNSVTNIVLHLCGNVRQWIGHGVGGMPDVRNRPKEFSDRTALNVQHLLERLERVTSEADAVLAGIAPGQLLEPRRIQGFDGTILDAIVNCVTHFRGHTQEIIYITRLRLGERYRFHFVPQGAEQEAAREDVKT